MNRNTGGPTDAFPLPPGPPGPVRRPGLWRAALHPRADVRSVRQQTQQKPDSAGNMMMFIQTAMEGAVTPPGGGDRDRWQKRGKRKDSGTFF